ncbi:hypothetical protein Xoosp14_132 [Xanthomonas phage Xoo-sp14]|nr:hypothetical protein Xoosp14_132 [Xanthomonas phage Xoo-sp14]
MDVCPLAKTGQELVLDLVNAENNSEITVEQLMFGTPQAGNEDGNTGLNLVAAPDSPWNKDVDIVYDRLDLNTLFHGQRAELSAPKGATKEDIVCHLNFTYDLKFTASEFDLTAVEDGELPELFKLKAKEGNLAYTGEMDIFVDLDRMPLSARLLKTDLNGFRYPNADEPSLNNPVVRPNVRSTWAPRQNGNTWGYDEATNGELFLGFRGLSRKPADSTGSYPGHPADPVTGRRSLYGWRYTSPSNVTSSTGWEVWVGLRYEGKTPRQLMEDYDIFFETKSRATADAEWVTRTWKWQKASAAGTTHLFRVVGDPIAGTDFGSVAGENLPANATITQLVPTNANVWPGLLYSNFVFSGEAEYRFYAVRKDGKGKLMNLLVKADVIKLPAVANPPFPTAPN